MQSHNSHDSSLISFAIHSVHFYASMIGGWWFFHNGIYPLAYFAKGVGSNLVTQLPVYAGNTLAFGCMVYVMTRPVAVLCVHLVDEIGRAMDRHFNK